MPVVKYAAFPTARIEAFNQTTQYTDLATLDFSTQGHGVYNYGNLTRLEPLPVFKTAYSTHITEVDIALGDMTKLKNAVKSLADNGYKNVYLMQSSLASVLGIDLNSCAEECAREFGVNVFTSETRLHDDCFIGAQEILYTLSHFATDCAFPKDGFNLFGGRLTPENKDNHKYLAELIEKELQLPLKFDSLNASLLSEWKDVSGALLNVVTAKSAIKTAESLKARFGTPYIYFLPFGQESEERGLRNIANVGNVDYMVSDDKVYALALTQFRNIIGVSSPKIVCYSDADRLLALKEFFSGICDSVEYMCSHADNNFKSTDINDFIEKYADRDCFVLSYDRVCKYMKKSVSIENLGLDYKLLTPLRNVTCGKEGAYRLMEKMANILFNE